MPPFAGRTDPPSVSVDCGSCICPPLLSCPYHHVPPSSRPFLSLYMTVACGPPLRLCPPPAEGPASPTQQVFSPDQYNLNLAKTKLNGKRKFNTTFPMRSSVFVSFASMSGNGLRGPRYCYSPGESMQAGRSRRARDHLREWTRGRGSSLAAARMSSRGMEQMTSAPVRTGRLQCSTLPRRWSCLVSHLPAPRVERKQGKRAWMSSPWSTPHGALSNSTGPASGL